MYFGRNYWIKKQVNGKIQCSVDYLGVDPEYDSEKFCYCEEDLGLLMSPDKKKDIRLEEFCIHGDGLETVTSRAEVQFKVASTIYQHNCLDNRGNFCSYG